MLSNRIRRAGGPARVVASIEKIHQAMGRKAERNLEVIFDSVWNWYQSRNSSKNILDPQTHHILKIKTKWTSIYS